MSVRCDRTLKIKKRISDSVSLSSSVYERKARSESDPSHPQALSGPCERKTTRVGGDEVYSNSESSYPDQWLANERAYLSEDGLKKIRYFLVMSGIRDLPPSL